MRYIEEDDIPENALIIVDIELLKFLVNSYIKKIKSVANCFHNSKKLTCTVVMPRSDDSPYDYTPTLVRLKIEKSISSVIQWKGMSGDSTHITLTQSFNFYYADKIRQENSKNIFYINIHSDTKIPQESYFTIDILIENTNKVCDCVALNQTNIKCEIDSSEDITNKKVYISKDKNLGTLAWSNLEANQYLFSSKLTYIHAYNFKFNPNDNHYIFTIIVTGDDSLKNDIIYPVKVHRIVNDKIGGNVYEKMHTAQCINTDGFLSCDITRVFPEKDTYKLKLLSSGDTVEWNNPGDYTIDEALSYVLHFKEIIYCEYDDTNNYYKYSIELSQTIVSLVEINKMVMDLKINEKESYGICILKEPKMIECHTPVMTKGENDKIVIIKSMKHGNIDWRELTADKSLYPLDYINVIISKIYDLEYVLNKWRFFIISENSLSFTDAKKTNILVNNSPSTATCIIGEGNNKLLICQNDQETQPTDLLITLSKEVVKNTQYINLIFPRFDGVPLMFHLEFVSASGLKYTDDDWSFTLKVKKHENAVIASGSTFSTDIIYNTNIPELAFCLEKERDSNILTLICKPQNKINKDATIKLSNAAKTTYASITWDNTISEEDTYIYLDLSLNVDYVTLPEFDNTNNKWKFNMHFEDEDIPSGTKARIDILYNNQEAMASCVLNNENIFECSLDVESQKSTDTFSIVSPKKNGNINFLNSADNLKFIYSLFYEKAYNLKFNNNKWSFNIQLSASNLKNGQKISIDISINGVNNKA